MNNRIQSEWEATRDGNSLLSLTVSFYLYLLSEWYKTSAWGGVIKSVLKTLNYSVNTYIHNEEVEPTPGIGEVLDKAVCDPLQQHLQNENIGKDLVCILQHYFDGLLLLDVNVLKCLSRKDAIKLFHLDPCSERRLLICKAHSGVVYSLTCRLWSVWQTTPPNVVIHGYNILLTMCQSLIHLPNIPLILEVTLSEKRFTSQRQIQNNTHLPEPHCWGGSWKWWTFQTSCAPQWWSRFFWVSTSSCNCLPPCWSGSSGTYAHSLQARGKRAKPHCLTLQTQIP